MSEPIFERLAGDAEHAWHDITAHLRHHHELPSAPAETTSSTGDTTMKLAAIEADIRNDITSAQEWITQAVENHLPALATEAAKAQASPIMQAIEGLVLPDGTEAVLAKFITDFAAKFGTTAAAASTGTTAAAPAPAADSQPAVATDAVVDASAAQAVPVTAAS